MRTIKCLYAISVLVVVVLTSCAYRPKVIVESESIVVESHIDSSYLGNTLVYEVHLASFDEDNCPQSSQDEELAQVTASLGNNDDDLENYYLTRKVIRQKYRDLWKPVADSLSKNYDTNRKTMESILFRQVQPFFDSLKVDDLHYYLSVKSDGTILDFTFYVHNQPHDVPCSVLSESVCISIFEQIRDSVIAPIWDGKYFYWAII